MGKLPMSADIIRHPDRLRQIIDFSTFAVRASDVDFEAEITSDIVVRGEAKFGDTSLSGGQFRSAQNWVERMGQTTHAFYVVATHDVPASQPITAQNLIVKAVLFRLPSMSRAMTLYYDYDHRPLINMFLGGLVRSYGQFRYLCNELEADPLWFFDPLLCAAYDSPLAQEQRERNHVAAEQQLNQFSSNGPLVLPRDLRTSEQHRRDFLSWTPETGLPEPWGWHCYQDLGEPSHLFY